MTQLNRDEKSQVVAEVVRRLEGTEAVVTADFRGLTVAEIAELRTKLREADAEMTVVKNTLSRRAADEAGRSALLPYLTGPTGLVWVNGDPARAAKVLSEFAKAHEEVFSVRGGVLGTDDLPAASIVKLASLPSREQMLAQLAGGMIAPISGLASGLNALIGTMARTLAAVRDSGALAPGEAPAAEPADAPAAEAPVAEATAADDAVAPGDAPETADAATAEEPVAQADPSDAAADDASAADATSEPAPDADTETPSDPPEADTETP